jgi:NTP pyrophosphatase (non-canonical NTP hydrolase)
VGNERLFETLREFVAERDWSQFHTPANLSKSISIEAAELLECFQWDGAVTQENLEAVKDELADVLTYCFLLADKLDQDPESLILEKLEKTKAKYPVDKARGKSVKYDRLDD